MSDFDIAIVGAGIAGATLAAAIGDRARVLMLEAEDQPGYHATGRSAAFWSETYGGPAIQPLTTESGPVLSAGGFLEPLGSLHIGGTDDVALAEAMLAEFDGTGVALAQVDPAEWIPGLRAGWTIGVHEPSCAYIDVGAYHGDALARARRAGAVLRTRAALRSAERGGAGWRLTTAAWVFSADILVDAAGAWADPVATMAGVTPLGIRAFRRTMVQLRTEPAPPADLPHIAGLRGDFYFKPEAGGRLWLSPHDEIESDAIDVAPEEMDVAVAIDRFEHVVDWRVAAVERRWAGLRSFAPDRLPVYGFDEAVPGFFWFAGQGGFGIQTAPAAADLAARVLLGEVPGTIDPARYAPARFRANLC